MTVARSSFKRTCSDMANRALAVLSVIAACNHDVMTRTATDLERGAGFVTHSDESEQS